MKWPNIILIVLLSAFVSIAAVTILPIKSRVSTLAEPPVTKQETAFERVMRTGTLRCGYNDWAPFFSKNLQTGEPEGFMVDLFTEIGKLAGLRVEWTTAVNWDTIPADLNAGKVDSFCAAVYATSVRAKGMLFSDPVGYQNLEPYVRSDDQRFTGLRDGVFNKPEIRIVGWEGTSTLQDAQRHFPKATFVSMPTNAGVGSAYLYVMDNKADVFFTSAADAVGFMVNNPGMLKRLPPEYYLGRQALALNAALGEHDLINFFNTSLRELHSNGTFDELVTRYNAQTPDFMAIR